MKSCQMARKQVVIAFQKNNIILKEDYAQLCVKLIVCLSMSVSVCFFLSVCLSVCLPAEGSHAGALAASAGISALAWHARSLEVFLDHVASAVENRRCRILLNPKYDALLSPQTAALRERLRAFLASLDDDSKRSGAFKQVQELLLDMGLRTEEAQRLADDPTIEGPYRRRLSKLRGQMPSHRRRRLE